MNTQYQDLRVMVTAGASGIGLGIAQAFAQAGAQVEISDISAEAIQAALPSIPAGGGRAGGRPRGGQPL